MSSTIGHAMCGISCLVLAQGVARSPVLFSGWRWMAGFALLASLPDLDFLAGFILAGNFHGFHGGPSHSMFAVLAAVILIGFVLPSGRRLQVTPWIAVAVASHIVIDLFTGLQPGLHQSYGVALYWPFWDERVRMPITLFYGVSHMTVDALLSWRNVKVVVIEMATFGVLLLFLRVWANTRISTMSVWHGERGRFEAEM